MQDDYLSPIQAAIENWARYTRTGDRTNLGYPRQSPTESARGGRSTKSIILPEYKEEEKMDSMMNGLKDVHPLLHRVTVVVSEAHYDFHKLTSIQKAKKLRTTTNKMYAAYREAKVWLHGKSHE